jgi:hypothetical protein
MEAFASEFPDAVMVYSAHFASTDRCSVWAITEVAENANSPIPIPKICRSTKHGHLLLCWGSREFAASKRAPILLKSTPPFLRVTILDDGKIACSSSALNRSVLNGAGTLGVLAAKGDNLLWLRRASIRTVMGVAHRHTTLDVT